MNSRIAITILAIFIGFAFSSCKVSNEESVSAPRSDISSASSLSQSSEIQTAAKLSSSESISSKVLSTSSELSNKKYGWGPGKITNHARPSSATGYNEKFADYDAFFIGDDQKKIYLTFDEGYENGYTAGILDTLKQKDVSAVFFVTYDYARKNPELIKRMIDEGHIVGNHSYSHPSMPDISDQKAKDEIMKLHTFMKENYGYDMTLFRFPMGEFSERTLCIAKQNGYKSIFWSFAYTDWYTDNQPDPAVAEEKILSATHNGAIYLLHAVSKTNAQILPDIIDKMRKQGFEISKFDL